MREISKEKELDLLGLIVRIYLLFKRRMKIIIAITTFMVAYGTSKKMNNINSDKKYEAKVGISSKYLRKELIDETIRKMFFNEKDKNYSDLNMFKLSKDVSFETIGVKEQGDDSIIYLSIYLKKGNTIDSTLQQFIQLICNQDVIKEKVFEVEKFKIDYLQKVDEKLFELENYNKLLIVNLSDKNHNTLLNNAGISNKEFFALTEKKLIRELDKDAPPITYKIFNIKKINRFSDFFLPIIVYLLTGLILGFFIAYIFELASASSKIDIADY